MAYIRKKLLIIQFLYNVYHKLVSDCGALDT